MTLFLLILLYSTLNYYVTGKINKANYQDEERRRMHKTLIWAVPFLGPLIIRSFWAKNQGSHDEM